MTYSVKDIQEKYGVSQGTVLHWLTSGQLRCLNLGRDPGKKRARYKVPQKFLDEFEAARAISPPHRLHPAVAARSKIPITWSDTNNATTN